MVKPGEIAKMLEDATAVMRARGVKRLRWGDLEIDLDEEPSGPAPAEDPEGPQPPEVEDVTNPYEDPVLYGGRVPFLRRKE